MRTDVECLPCFVRQSLQVARIAGCTHSLQLAVVQKVAALAAGLNMALSPPANAGLIYRAIAEITGCQDPYRLLKQTSNGQALKILPGLRREIRGSASEFTMAVRFAIAGNIIDYGAFASFDILGALEKCRHHPPIIDHTALLQSRVEKLRPSDKVLYLADNSGEIVYDLLLLEYFSGYGPEITVAVKDGPIINDALVEDARAVGLERMGRIISNGTRCPGTVLAQCSDEFRQAFAAADLVISKGQGNFESLSEVDREIFFLLTLKCPVAARHLAERAGVEAARLPGQGEMAVYFSAKNN
jgi:damage-control phosphatase, subfamily I